MAVGDIISASRYNNIQNRIAVVMGQGAGNTGYGQTLLSSQKPIGSVVTVADATALRTDMIKARQHQTGLDESGVRYSFLPSAISTTNNTITISGHTFTNGTQVILFPTFDEAGNPSTPPSGLSYNTAFYVRDVSGNTFKLAATETGSALPIASQGTMSHEIFSGFPIYTKFDRITEASFLNFEKKIEVIENDKFLIGPNQATVSAGVSSIRSTGWNSKLTHIVTVDFGSANSARYFFNSGSELRLDATLSSGNGDSIYNNWVTMLTNMGIIKMNYTQTVTTGTGTGSSIGFYDLTSTNQQIFTKVGSGTYSANDYTVYARCDVANNTQGTARYVYLTIEFNDDKGPNPNFDENVTGTLTSNVGYMRATGTNVQVVTPSLVSTVELGTNNPIPSYSIGTSTQQIEENSSVTFDVIVLNVANGTTLYWTTIGSVDASDFVDGQISGQVVINNGTATIVRAINVFDSNSDINETFALELRTGSVSGTIVSVSNTVLIINKNPYLISGAPTFVNETTTPTITFTVTTVGVANNTTMYWRHDASSTALANDFTDNSIQGTVIINNNSGTFTRTVRADNTADPNSETLVVNLYTDAARTVLVATSNTITIADTSQPG